MKKIFILLFFILISIGLHSQTKPFKFKNGVAACFFVDETGLCGVKDSLGNIMVPAKYGKLYHCGNILCCLEKEGGINKYSIEIYNSQGELRIPKSAGLTTTNTEFVYSKGQYLISARYAEAILDENANLIYKYKTLTDSKGFKYLVNEVTDTIILPPGIYTDFFRIDGDVIHTRIGNKVGIVNLDGTEVIPADKYSSITRNTTLSITRSTYGFYVNPTSSSGGFQGFYDRDGNCIIPADKYTRVSSLDGGKFCVIENGKAGIIDSSGNILLKTKYTSLALAKDKQNNYYYKTYLGNGRGSITLNGDVIEEVKPTIEEKQDDNYIQVLDTSGLYGAKSFVGETILPCKYDRIYYSTHGTIKGFEIYKNGCVGFADNKGQIIIPPRYHGISSIGTYGKYFVVSHMDKKGLCDNKGKELIKPIYDDIDIYKDVIYAKIRLMKGVIDSIGNILVPFEYTDISFDKKTGNYKVKLFDKEGLCDKEGKIIIPANYTLVSYYDHMKVPNGNGVYSVKDGETEGLYTKEGKMIFPTGLFKHLMISNSKSDMPFENEWHIKAYNDLNEQIYYFDLDGNLLYDNKNDKIFEKHMVNGSEEFKKENYKAAISHYNKALKVKKHELIYYNIGASYYNLKDYKNAISHFTSCANIAKNQNVINEVSELITECKLNLQQEQERRTRLCMEALNFTFNVASVIVQTNNATTNYNKSINSKKTQNAVSSFDNDDSCEDSDSNTVDSQDRKKGNSNKKSSKICLACKGSGKCSACDGSKIARRFGLIHDCNVCNSNGDCNICNGTGKAN